MCHSYSPVSPCGLSEKHFPPWKVELQVLSGQHIPKPEGEVRGEVIDPYVKVWNQKKAACNCNKCN